MGECMSLCNTKNVEEEDIKKTRNNQLPIDDLTLLRPSSLKDSSTPRRTKKNKTSAPKVVSFKIDEKKLVSKMSKDSLLHFEEITDDKKSEKSDKSDKSEDDKVNENKSVDSSISGLKYDTEQEQESEQEKENNNYKTKKPEVKWDLLTDKLISNKINKLKDEMASNEEKKNENANIKIIDKNNELIDNEKNNEEENINNNNDSIIKKNNEENNNSKNEISEENEYNKNNDEKNNIKENNKEKEIININKKDEENKNLDSENLKKQSIEKEANNAQKNEEIENEEEEEEDDEDEENNINQKKNENLEKTSLENKDLKKYDFLVKIINKNIEAKGFSKSSIIQQINELYKSFSDTLPLDDFTLKLSEDLIKLLEINIDTDKTIIHNFIKELIQIYENDKNKIYNQLIKYAEGIEDQEKLKTKAKNRQIRSYIKDRQDKLKERLKMEDIPPDKIISFETFYQIVEETDIQLKEEYIDILLYQMKIAVPKGRSFNTLNAIVIIDFLK